MLYARFKPKLVPLLTTFVVKNGSKIRLRYPTTGVLDLNPDVFAFLTRSSLCGALLVDALSGVEKQVEKDLP